jgi:hypothetical protein
MVALIIYLKPVFNPNLPAPYMRIFLDLSRHCIETELRRRHHRAVADALRPGADLDAAEGRIALLRSALDGLDFPRLRADHASLNAESPATVTLVREADGARLSLRVDDMPVAHAPLREAP